MFHRYLGVYMPDFLQSLRPPHAPAWSLDCFSCPAYSQTRCLVPQPLPPTSAPPAYPPHPVVYLFSQSPLALCPQPHFLKSFLLDLKTVKGWVWTLKSDLIVRFCTYQPLEQAWEAVLGNPSGHLWFWRWVTHLPQSSPNFSHSSTCT